MPKFTRLTPEQREELIAYLDGELEPSRQETIEASLSQNQVARHDLNQLSKTYDLLTFLPRVTPNPELAERTLSRIEVRESQVWTSPSLSVNRLRRYLMGTVWFILLSATAVGAFQIAQQFREDRMKLLLEDLPVIENVDRFSAIEADIELLKKLRDEKIFDEGSREEE